MPMASELVDRFRADLAATGFGDTAKGQSLGVALSGGGDSLALLLLAHAALPGRVEAATVDHQLRPESGAEAQQAAQFCRELGVPHQILPVQVPPGNLQAQARAARYQALEKWSADNELAALSTAHHLDDQIETLLMRLNRGSGLTGLSSIRASGTVPGKAIRLIRPLLNWRRSELRAIVAAHGWQPIEDPSNTNAAFDRVRMREALADADWIVAEGFARSATLLAQADDAIAAVVACEYTSCVSEGDAEITLDPQRRSLENALVTGGILRSIFRTFGASIDQGEAARVLTALGKGQKINIAGIEARVNKSSGKNLWLFRRENPRRSNA